MADLGIAQRDALKNVRQESLPAKLADWVTQLCGSGGVADNNTDFVKEVVNTPWVLTDQPLLGGRSLLAIAKEGSEAALGRYPGARAEDPAAPAGAAADAPVLVISRGQGLVLCGVAQEVQLALEDGLQNRLARLMGHPASEHAGPSDPVN